MMVPEATGAWAHSGVSRTEEAAQREGHEYENDGPHWIWLLASAVSGVTQPLVADMIALAGSLPIFPWHSGISQPFGYRKFSI